MLRDFFTRRAATGFHVTGAYAFGVIVTHSNGWHALAGFMGYLAFIFLASFIAVYYSD
jgi:hypothetical protein